MGTPPSVDSPDGGMDANDVLRHDRFHHSGEFDGAGGAASLRRKIEV